MRRRSVHLLAALSSLAHGLSTTSARAPSAPTAYARDGVAFVRDFLPAAEYEKILQDCRSLRGALKKEKNSIAIGRTGRMVDRQSVTHECLTSELVAQRVAKLCGAQLVPSEYPTELRVYGPAAGMDWHQDDVMYDEPQMELVYCLENTSDSYTEWIPAGGSQELRSEFTPPNSALLVRAGDAGARHRVQTLRRGERTILKQIWHRPDSEPLERFYQHLDSLPGLRAKQRPKKASEQQPKKGQQRRR